VVVLCVCIMWFQHGATGRTWKRTLPIQATTFQNARTTCPSCNFQVDFFQGPHFSITEQGSGIPVDITYGAFDAGVGDVIDFPNATLWDQIGSSQTSTNIFYAQWPGASCVIGNYQFADPTEVELVPGKTYETQGQSVKIDMSMVVETDIFWTSALSSLGWTFLIELNAERANFINSPDAALSTPSVSVFKFPAVDGRVVTVQMANYAVLDNVTQQIGVFVSNGSDYKSVVMWMIFPHFDTWFFYDPDFGVLLSATSETSDEGNGHTLLIVLVTVLIPVALIVLATAFLAIIATSVAAYIVHRRRLHHSMRSGAVNFTSED